MRWLAFVIGVLIVSSTAASVVGTLVVPRQITSYISRGSDAFSDAVFRLLSAPARTFQQRDRILAWQGPVLLVLRLTVWMTLLYLGFAFMLMPFVPGDVGRSFAQSGSSMFTLGYAGPNGTDTTAVDYIAAFSGLVAVGLQIGYLPTLYAAFNRRETEVTLLVARAGIPAWGPELLARTRYGMVGGADQAVVLANLFATWERWSAEVAESHTTYLSLTRLRSPRPMSHWLTSLLAVMDAAALHLSLSPGTEPVLQARLALRMGFTAMQQIGRAMGLQVDDDPEPDRPITVTFSEFEAAFDMLTALRYPVSRTAEEAWPHFQGWRVNYEAVALRIAYLVDAPPALWSGSRRWPSTPIPPHRPPNRVPDNEDRPTKPKTGLSEREAN